MLLSQKGEQGIQHLTGESDPGVSKQVALRWGENAVVFARHCHLHRNTMYKLSAFLNQWTTPALLLFPYVSNKQSTNHNIKVHSQEHEKLGRNRM